MNRRGLFVTGTGTEIGKTVTSAWLCYHLQAKYWKPIQSGNLDQLESTAVQTLAGLDDDAIHPQHYKLTQPLSPHLAARFDGVTINFDQLVLPTSTQTIVVEGAGGALAPLNETQLITDLISYLQLPAVVVATSGLGTINHTCMTLEVLRNRDINVRGVIMVGPLNDHNRIDIEHYGKVKVIAQIPWFEPLTADALKHIQMTKECREILSE